MRKLILAAVMASAALPLTAAPAQSRYDNEYSREQRECARELREADNAREYRREQRECRRELRDARRDVRRDSRRDRRDWRRYNDYDHDRYEQGYNAYYPERYYRDGRYYGETRLTSRDRIYRGQDGRYYCRRSDGTTGLIVGGAIGALIGNSVDGGRSSLLGTLIGGGAGALLGREIEQGNVRCR